MPDPPPSSPAADRNLLFGVLALQMDFVSRDDLVAAMHAWVLDKRRRLGDILRSQGRLAADEHALLDALVDKHLRRHDGDARQSLASLGRPVVPGEELRGIADPDLQASLVQLPGGDAPAAVERTTAYAPVRPPGARFEVLRPHARGGLGEVFVARDAELDRDVALKEIQGCHAGRPDLLSRFLLEAKVTGALEHPGVVPIYSLGTYADGRPFYAMRFVQGQSLRDAIEAYHADRGRRTPSERSLALRGLLGRFVDVCNALAYAHSRGVLHRDVKPANVMLGKYGETLVVDWGLAKVLGKAEVEITEAPLPAPGSADVTHAGRALGTPAYMSPEQAAGHVERMGPRSDVYSLGATLYCLLTGRPPFGEGEAGGVLRRVERGDFPRPREVARDVPAALEAVCLKAMAREPAGRYATPRDLAEEVEHWLAYEPVGAHRESAIERAHRWMRRHQTLTAAALAVLLTCLPTLLVSTVIVAQEQHKTAEVLRHTQDALEQSEASRQMFQKILGSPDWRKPNWPPNRQPRWWWPWR
jgi:serine/threonine-protein kinase